MTNLRESLGVAVNSGSLKIEEDTERAADRVAALAFCEDLGSLLWRMKYGGQTHYREVTALGAGQSAFNRIALRLEHWLRKNDRRRVRSELFARLVRLALADWLADKCETCRGRGVLGVERATVQAVRGRCPQCAGSGYTERATPRGGKLQTICQRCCGIGKISASRSVEREKPRPCPACSGLGVAVVSTSNWALLLGVSREEWLKNWDKPMNRLRGYLGAIDRRTHAQLSQQLERD